MTELQECGYTLDGQKCSEIAEIFCQIGTCLPGTHFCGYHYQQVHLPEDERDEIDLVFHPPVDEPQEPILVACPYCVPGTMHYKYQIDLCPNNPYR